MPWTAADADRHKKGLSASQKRQWAHVANAALAKCLKDGGSQSTCEGSAIRQANSAVGRPSTQSRPRTTNNDYQIRQESHQGRRHIVVPVVMMTEGVHHGSHGALFHPAEELGRFVQTWNGIPVTIQHPEDDSGQNVSANSPEVIDQWTVGRVYNAHMDGPKLKAEVWIDEQRISQLSPEALAYIRRGLNLDVSVGLFSEEELTPGVWNNEQYVGIARNHRPDHLALLPGGTGACSWADGCGIRANKEETMEKEETENEEETPEETTEEERVLAINNLPDSAFAYIEPGGKKDSSGKTTPLRLRHFPIHDVANVRKSLAVLSEAEFGPEAKKKVLAAARKFKVPVSDQAMDGAFADLTAKELLSHGYLINLQQYGYREIMSCIQNKLDRMDDDIKIHFLQEVFDNFFIYEVRGRMGAQYSGSGLYKRNYSVNEDGTVDFTGESKPVRRDVQYVDIANNEGDPTTMADANKKKAEEPKPAANAVKGEEAKKPCCPEKVQALIASEHTPYKEADKEWLSSLDEAQIENLITMEKAAGKPAESKPNPPVDPPVITNEQAVQVLRDQLKTPEQFIKLLPNELQDQMTSALQLHQQERSRLVDAIKSASRYTDEQLKGKTMAELAILAEMAKPKDFSVLRGGSPLQADDADNLLLPPGVSAPAKTTQTSQGGER